MRRALVVVVAADLVTATTEARANPPPPTQALPDPRIEAPGASEAPHVVRRHTSGCFALFSSGGALLVPCPAELLSEGVGASMQREGSRCRHVPLLAGTSGAKDGYAPCPAVFDQRFVAGEIDPASRALLERRRPLPPSPPWSPPIPAKLAAEQPEPPEGCGHSASSPRSLFGPMVVLAALGRRRRKR